MSRDNCYYTVKYSDATDNICNLRHKTLKVVSANFHNGFDYNYHLIIKGLAAKFKRQFEGLGENIEKNMTFLVPIKKEKKSSKKVT